MEVFSLNLFFRENLLILKRKKECFHIEIFVNGKLKKKVEILLFFPPISFSPRVLGAIAFGVAK